MNGNQALRPVEDEVMCLECFYCKGNMVRGKTSYALSRRGYHLLIDEVPAWVCQQCGEVYFEGGEVDAIQDLIKTLDLKVVNANLVKPT